MKELYIVDDVELDYYRKGVAVIHEGGSCDKCGQETACLWVDTSEREYGPVGLCQNCITKAFEEFTAMPDRGEICNSLLRKPKDWEMRILP